MRAPILMLVAAMYAPSSSIRAQEPDLGLFESTYIVFANPTPNQIGAPSYYDEVGDGGNLITETQIVTHFRWLRGLNREMLAAGQSSWKVNAIATFQFRLRALQDASSPIRSPSYMPRLTGQLMKAYGGDPASPNAGRRNVVGFVGTVGHHSNGGDGCVFEDEVFDAARITCVSPSPRPSVDTREVRPNGNFSTNYWQVGFFHRFAQAEAVGGNGRLKWSLDLLLSTQFHTGFDFVLAGADRQFGKLYGKVRPRVDVAFHRMLPISVPWLGSGSNWALRARGMYEAFSPEFERYPGALEYRFEAEAMFQAIPAHGETSRVDDFIFGLRYIRGQDSYNTQFVRDIERLQFVVIIDSWTPWLLP